jgi:hypothetical protein
MSAFNVPTDSSFISWLDRVPVYSPKTDHFGLICQAARPSNRRRTKELARSRRSGTQPGKPAQDLAQHHFPPSQKDANSAPCRLGQPGSCTISYLPGGMQMSVQVAAYDPTKH